MELENQSTWCMESVNQSMESVLENQSTIVYGICEPVYEIGDGEPVYIVYGIREPVYGIVEPTVHYALETANCCCAEDIFVS